MSANFSKILIHWLQKIQKTIKSRQTCSVTSSTSVYCSHITAKNLATAMPDGIFVPNTHPGQGKKYYPKFTQFFEHVADIFLVKGTSCHFATPHYNKFRPSWEVKSCFVAKKFYLPDSWTLPVQKAGQTGQFFKRFFY